MSRQDLSSRIYMIVEGAGLSSLPLSEVFNGWQTDWLRNKLLRAGIIPDSVLVSSFDVIEKQNEAFTLIALGESPLRELTGKRGIDKWQLSPLKDYQGRNVIPTFDMSRVQAQYELGLFQEFAFRRAKEINEIGYKPVEERFLLNPGVEETLAILDQIKDKPELAIDVETGYGQINTVGFAWSESDAIAINVLPDRLNDLSYYSLMAKIRDVLEGPSAKIFQNFIYDVSYFSAYGIRVRNIAWDTMWGMKVLWPELKSNLGNVGRIYTRRPYWKDDGKVTDEEGQKKDWGNVRDWTRHYLYNCRDTTGTLESARNQSDDFKSRGLDGFFRAYVQKLVAPTLEMCSRGVPFSESVREQLKKEVAARIEDANTEFRNATGKEINPRSPKQLQTYLKEKGIEIPRKFDKKKGESRQSVDAGAIKKLRLKYPKMKELEHLQEIKTLEKALSSYIDFRATDDRIRYSINMCGTETLRGAGHCDPWDRGFNIQTIPREGGKVSIKSMMIAPAGQTFVEIDLSQAESRYVAYASACPKLIEMLESGADVHRHVAHAILRGLGLSAEEYSKLWRNLGKKTGHGANYLMKEGTFVENVFKDMDMVLTKPQAKIILESYFQEFPEIRRWHSSIRNELYNKRKLSAPTGWERYFYGRFGDDMIREGVAWAPQHTIPFITNKLMLYLCDQRDEGKVNFDLLVQVHDSLIFLCPEGDTEILSQIAADLKVWHPKITLPGGDLWIKTETKKGKSLAEMR